MLIYLADNRSTVINLQCVGDMHIEKSRYGWEIKCEMSSVSGLEQRHAVSDVLLVKKTLYQKF